MRGVPGAGRLKSRVRAAEGQTCAPEAELIGLDAKLEHEPSGLLLLLSRRLEPRVLHGAQAEIGGDRTRLGRERARSRGRRRACAASRPRHSLACSSWLGTSSRRRVVSSCSASTASAARRAGGSGARHEAHSVKYRTLAATQTPHSTQPHGSRHGASSSPQHSEQLACANAGQARRRRECRCSGVSSGPGGRRRARRSSACRRASAALSCRVSSATISPVTPPSPSPPPPPLSRSPGSGAAGGPCGGVAPSASRAGGHAAGEGRHTPSAASGESAEPAAFVLRVRGEVRGDCGETGPLPLDEERVVPVGREAPPRRSIPAAAAEGGRGRLCPLPGPLGLQGAPREGLRGRSSTRRRATPRRGAVRARRRRRGGRAVRLRLAAGAGEWRRLARWRPRHAPRQLEDEAVPVGRVRAEAVHVQHQRVGGVARAPRLPIHAAAHPQTSGGAT